MGALEGRVAVITGAGRGLGREHALLFASEGAKVVVNDLGGDQQGGGADATPAQQTVDDIRAMGGEAVVNGENVADWDGARRLVEQAVDTFGDLHVLVNNAGILRDRVVVNMTEDEWDSVVRVHLKGHFAPAHFAANYWREQTKSGREINAAIVNTTSTSGLFSNPGQANYDAAKSGIATLTQVMAKELVRYGVRANAIAPGARTRLTLSTPGLGDAIGEPDRRFVRPVVAGERLAVRRVPQHRRVHDHGRDVRRARRRRATGADLDARPRRSTRTTAGPSPNWRGGPGSSPRGSRSRRAARAPRSTGSTDGRDATGSASSGAERRGGRLVRAESWRVPCGVPRTEQRAGRARPGP